MDELQRLEASIRQDLARTAYPARAWVPNHPSPDASRLYDVVIVGGGQSGLAAAFALKRERIDNILVVDSNPEDHAGPWLNFARMKTLRTPKYLTGPDLGVASLTIQSWYEARYGAAAWQSLELIPKAHWAEYLNWYRRFLELPVCHETTAGALQWNAEASCFRVPLSDVRGERHVWARRVVLATGIEGSGHWFTPSFITEAIGRDRYAHTRDVIDFDGLRGRRIGVLGAGASAFDNGSMALEAGAASVDLFFRRPELVKVNPYRWAEFVGFLKHLGDLEDRQKWTFIRQILRMGQLPPADTFRRATAHKHFRLRPGTEWIGVRPSGEKVVVETNRGASEFDYLIVATGFRTDLSVRPELANCVESIALWGDRFHPPDGERHDDLLRHPYLGAGFELQPKHAGENAWVGKIYNYTFGGLLSLGFGGASISGMKYSIPRLVGSITASLFAEDSAEHLRSLRAFELEEF